MGSQHAPEAERSVLAAILLDNVAYHVAVGIVQPQDFFSPTHQAIARAFDRLHEAKRPMDPVTLAEELTKSGDLDAVGGALYIHRLLDGMTRATNVEHYATTVKEKSTIRRLTAYATALLEQADSPAAEMAELMELAETGLLDISRGASRGGFVLASDWMSRTYANIDKAQARGSAVSGLPSGLPSLDEYTRGFQNGDLVIIGGRTSSGKTALFMQVMLEASRHTMAAIVSLEMSAESLGFRVVATEARVDAFKMLQGRLNDAEMASVGLAITRLGGRPIAIDDTSGQTVAEVCSKLRRLSMQHKLGIAGIDYVQLMSGSGKVENRTREVGEIAHRMKALAKDLHIPIVVLSQVNRGTDGNAKEPQIHQLRESGDLEHDCDLLLLIWRPNQHADDKALRPDDVAHIRVAKQRNGPQGRLFKARWHGPTMHFVEQAEEMQQGAFLP